MYLFTDDLAVMTAAHEAYEIELPTLSVEISLQGIGISVVDNFKTEEIAYMCIASSAIIWEQSVKTRFKFVSPESSRQFGLQHLNSSIFPSIVLDMI